MISMKLQDVLIIIFIVICCVAIIYFSIQIGGTLSDVYSSNATLKNGDKLDIVSIYSSLLVVLISIIGMTINTKYTHESIRQSEKNIEDNKKYNEKLLRQNDELLFIQLRFNDAKYGINKLMLFLQITLNISEQLKKLNNSDNSEKDKYLTNRAFLVMQFVNLTSDFELLSNLPTTLGTKIQYEFDHRINTDNIVDDSPLQLALIDENPSVKSIRNSIEYMRYINQFKENEHPNQNRFAFRIYHGAKNIQTDDFYKHFENILNEITTYSTEELILKDYMEITSAK